MVRHETRVWSGRSEPADKTWALMAPEQRPTPKVNHRVLGRACPEIQYFHEFKPPLAFLSFFNIRKMRICMIWEPRVECRAGAPRSSLSRRRKLVVHRRPNIHQTVTLTINGPVSGAHLGYDPGWGPLDPDWRRFVTGQRVELFSLGNCLRGGSPLEEGRWIRRWTSRTRPMTRTAHPSFRTG